MNRKTLCLLFVLVLLATPCFGTDYFWDPSCGTPGDGTGGDCDGDSDDAFDNYSDFYSVMGAGDTLWMRRGQTETFTVDVNFLSSSAVAPIRLVGWPRAAKSINADWTNGSTTVDNIDSNDMDKEKHQGRFVAGPDGFNYLITDISDANTIIIDRPYQGSTASNEDTNIQADTLPHYITQPNDPNNWDSDADDLPIWDGNSNNIALMINGDDNLKIYYLSITGFQDSSYGSFYVTGSNGVLLFGCLIYQGGNLAVFEPTDTSNLTIERSIIEGNPSGGASNRAFNSSRSQKIIIKDSAIYGFNGNAFYDTGTMWEFQNVNVGVEVANGSDDFKLYYTVGYKATDLKMGGTNGEIAFPVNTQIWSRASVTSVNHNKVLGAWKQYFAGYTFEKVAVSGETPNKKLSDDVIKITPGTNTNYDWQEVSDYPVVFKSRKTYDAGTYNIKVWIYNDTGNTLNDTTASDDIILKCRSEAAGYGDATTEYVSKWYYSDEIDIADAADADDWDFLQADSVVVGVSGAKIYCGVLASFYDAQADVVFVDPVTENP